MSDLTLYTHPMSRGCVVRWMLEEVGAYYTVKTLEFGGDMKGPEYLAINPMGKVPAIKHGDVVVTEVAAIGAYLADQFSEKNLAPGLRSPERGSYYRWLFFMAGPFEMATSAKAYGWRIDSDNEQSVGCGPIDASIETLEQALAKTPYICGEQFTAADVLVSSYLWWEMMQENIPKLDVFREYTDRMESRSAARLANVLDDELAEQLKVAAG
ncbi:glutathione S-transferase [Marinobacter sp. EVN1]|uniref:glutathione S-transferase family protein n=1 Tax=Marinobacter sp. EVN1 TaxID=1397532 RepID=UPI0003B881A0|nr:glutathione S-transferase family protein [Marinobacter sp. EVN1]ERS83679.1 glutathione S-transferase [Marinobacter sp. EVN1]